VSDLSILVVTRAEPHALPFLRSMRTLAFTTGAELVVAADGLEAYAALGDEFLVRLVKSQGYIESVLDEALAACRTDYVLRLDDDEKASPAMVQWLAGGRYREHPHWSFPRAHLWRDEQTAIVTRLLWPDQQTRLSLRALSGGRAKIHEASPHGFGTIAPCALLHYKFLVKSLDERRAIVERYERIQPGAGTGPFVEFSTPEEPVVDARLVPLDELLAGLDRKAA